MSQTKKRRKANEPVEKVPSPEGTGGDRKRKWQRLILVVVFIAILAATIGFFQYQNSIAPFRRTILTVDGISINMDDFIKRTRLIGATPFTMLQMFTDEQLIKLEAPQYVGEVSAEDVEQELRRIARGESATITESEFKEWYRQELNETKLSDAKYREWVATSLLAIRFQEYLAERVSTIDEQIHLHAIILETYEDAERIRARWEEGEDFADLAREVSLNEETKEKGGDIGWFPRGILDYGLEYTAFNLSTDNVSVPIPFGVSVPSADPMQPSPTQTVFYLLMVSEKADAREIDEDYLPMLKSRALQDWLMEEIKFHEVKYNFTSEISAWIEWQIARQ